MTKAEFLDQLAGDERVGSKKAAADAVDAVLDAITDIDLADPDLMTEAGLSTRSEESGGFRDFSRTGIERRREAGYRIAQLKLQELFESRGLLPTRH